MVTFEGFVESTSLVGDRLQMRLMVGGFDPSPTEPPVLKVTVEGLDTAQATYDELQRVLDVDDGVYLVAPAKFRLRRWLQARRNLNFAGATTYR